MVLSMHVHVTETRWTHSHQAEISSSSPTPKYVEFPPSVSEASLNVVAMAAVVNSKEQHSGWVDRQEVRTGRLIDFSPVKVARQS